MKIARTLSAVSFLGLLACSSSFAADAPAGGRGPEACRQDVQTLCPGVQPGEGRIRACMRKNHDKVSEACKAAMKQRHEERKAAGK